VAVLQKILCWYHLQLYPAYDAARWQKAAQAAQDV
jgi:hypothetical protein